MHIMVDMNNFSGGKVLLPNHRQGLFTFDKEHSKEINANGKKEAFHKMVMLHSDVALALILLCSFKLT